jgi:hypothetical protein
VATDCKPKTLTIVKEIVLPLAYYIRSLVTAFAPYSFVFPTIRHVPQL